jgi:fumarate hydratase class II
MGEMEVPAGALWGASTHRAVLNFPISGQRLPRRMIHAVGLIKQAAAEVNADLGLLDPDIASAISAAAATVAAGEHDDEFPIDVYQTGSGTSSNTNFNEVIAHLATERLNDGRRVHPNDQVNKCQSSNDVFPTAMQLAAALALEEELLPGLERLEAALRQKAEQFWPIVKTGRTHLQDATPIRLGQEFSGYAGQVEESLRRARARRSEPASTAIPSSRAASALGCGRRPAWPCARPRITSTRRRRSTSRSRPTARSARSR